MDNQNGGPASFTPLKNLSDHDLLIVVTTQLHLLIGRVNDSTLGLTDKINGIHSRVVPLERYVDKLENEKILERIESCNDITIKINEHRIFEKVKNHDVFLQEVRQSYKTSIFMGTTVFGLIQFILYYYFNYFK